ncbi:MAG: DUF503 domain-containing protein [Acidobacteriota bacterium]|nr:MAG: DUF503 domain-containing protein [Acidobacteriota bacterium]
MRVGLLVLEIFLHGCTSLKEKRRVIRAIRDRSRHRHNVALAEVDHQDLHQRAKLAFVSVASRRAPLDQLFDRIVEDAEELAHGGIEETVREFFG